MAQQNNKTKITLALCYIGISLVSATTKVQSWLKNAKWHDTCNKRLTTNVNGTTTDRTLKHHHD